jgi:apolipoprotein D and lipocalin family protein
MSLLTVILAILTACGTSYRTTSDPLVAQKEFDPERYLGLWYEIARFPVFFQKGCTATTAEYGPLDAGKISVLKKCRMGTTSGAVKEIVGFAEIVELGRLKVSFDTVPFVRGDYTVLWVDDTYHSAVVGSASGKAGWILARTPEIPPSTRQEAENILKSNGYDTTALIDVPHTQ